MYQDSTDFINQVPVVTAKQAERILIQHGIQVVDACEDELFKPIISQLLSDAVDTEMLLSWLGY